MACRQEETDRCLLLHAAHAAKERYQAVLIHSENTTVFIILAFHDKINVQLFWKLCTKTCMKFIDIDTIHTR